MPKKTQGFSLLVLMVVMVISITLLLINISFVFKWIETSKEKLFQQQLLTIIMLMKQLTRSYAAPISFCASTNMHQCHLQWQNRYVVFIDQEENGAIDQSATILLTIDLKNHNGKLYWHSFPHHQNYLTFLPDKENNNNGTFWYCRLHEKDPRWGNSINKAGLATILWPDSNGAINNSRKQRLICF